MSGKELTVVFGSEQLRYRYIKEHDVDPHNVICASAPGLIGVLQAGEDVTFNVVRYPDSSWNYIRHINSDKIAKTEKLLKHYEEQGVPVKEVFE